jgi:DNA-binding transcriptional MocR family regulator
MAGDIARCLMTKEGNLNSMKPGFASRMQDLRASDIREILKITQRPDVISFAGGLPASELLPTREMAELARELLIEDGIRALQYAPTEGLQDLREAISQRLKESLSLDRGPDEVLVVSGSQQGLDLAGKVFLDEGDAVLCESPTYLGAISAFRAYQARFVEVTTDDDGMVLSDLEYRLQSVDRVKFIYVVPDFQNPSGRRWTLERRRALVDLANRYRVPVIEDAPYANLCFDGEPLPPVASFDRAGLVILLGTFSKILAPGLRLGWVTAERDLLRPFVLAKQGADLQTSSLTQLLAAKFFSDHDVDAHIAHLCEVYRVRRDAMLRALDEFFPKEIGYTRPVGGLFLWVELPEDLNARTLLEHSLEEKVAFVPGECFYPGGGHLNTLRLNFSAMPEDRIAEGIRRLGRVFAAALEPVGVG